MNEFILEHRFWFLLFWVYFFLFYIFMPGICWICVFFEKGRSSANKDMKNYFKWANPIKILKLLTIGSKIKKQWRK